MRCFGAYVLVLVLSNRSCASDADAVEAATNAWDQGAWRGNDGVVSGCSLLASLGPKEHPVTPTTCDPFQCLGAAQGYLST